MHFVQIMYDGLEIFTLIYFHAIQEHSRLSAIREIGQLLYYI